MVPLDSEWAYIAVELAGAIQKRLAPVHSATRPKLLPTWAVVNVACRVISKVATREGATIPLRLVENRDMWRDAFLLYEPVQHRSCPVGGIPDKPLRLEAEALLCSLDHGLRRAYQRLRGFEAKIHGEPLPSIETQKEPAS
jgi:hypothetical protein